jgi:hypothetical protein
MMTEMDIETSVYNVHLTRLIAREDFIKFTRRESTKTHIRGADFIRRRIGYGTANDESWQTGEKAGSKLL